MCPKLCFLLVVGAGLLITWPCPAQTVDEIAELEGQVPVDDEGTDVPCDLGDRFSFQAEYLLWWLREGHAPPLLTTSSPASAGILGRSDTRILYGNDRLPTRHDDLFSGIRVSLDYWLTDDHSLGIMGSAFFLERDSTSFKVISDGSQVLARPYINALDGSAASEIIAGPGPLGPRNGAFVGYSRVELFGQEANVVVPLWTNAPGRLDLLLGAHFLQMRDRTDLTATGRLLLDPATLLGLTDHLRAEDRFYGGQVGLRGTWAYQRWFLAATGEVAPGATDATIRIFGDRLFQTPTERIVTPYGLAAQPSNTGRFGHTDFDVVSQVSLNAGYRLTARLTVFTGYTFLYWAEPLRSGDQIDLVVNPTLTTATPHGLPRPALPFLSDGFWAQGWNIGLELMF
jgi:hypothetical protein